VIGEIQIGRGGLLHRLEAAARLTSLPRQILSVLSITWLPVMVLGLATEWLSGEPDPTIRDLGMHVRLLVATPILLVLDQVFPRSCRDALQQLVAQGFVPASEEPRFERLLQRAHRLASALLPELLFVLIALASGVAALWGLIPIGSLAPRDPVSFPQVWYALVDWPLFQFLLWRSLWRWAIWGRVLLDLSRMDLALVPAHPDRRAGISFLSLPSVDYCALILFAVSSVLCAEWGGRLVFTTFSSFEPVLIAFAAIAILLAFGPLLCFTPPLVRARRAGLVESAGAAAAFSRRFRREWLEQRDHTSRPDTDPMPLVNVTELYRHTAQRMVPVLFDLRDLAVLLIATLSPVVPVMLLHIPSEDWRMVISLLTGGRLFSP
jgi:hypothetical protein